MHKIFYTGLLHFDYIYYYKIIRYSKAEIGTMMVQIKKELLETEDEHKKFNLNREYNLLSERYEELI
jgi:hypothetical protein